MHQSHDLTASSLAMLYRTAWLLAFLTTIGMAAGEAAENPRPKPAGQQRRGRIVFSEEQVRVFVAEVIPHVERVMDRKFKNVPALSVGDKEMVAKLLAADMEPGLHRQHPGLSGDQIADSARSSAEAMAPELLGKYGIKMKKLGLLPANLGPALRSHRIDPKHAPGVLKTLIAHELTHALQAESVDLLGLLGSVRSDDEEAALTAVIEGQAMFVQERVGEAMKLGEATQAYSKTFSLKNLDAYDTSDRLVAARQEFTYIEGRRFVEWHFRRGGAAAVWEVLARPPVATSMIARPETYSNSPPKRPDLSGVFAGQAERLQKAGWKIQGQDVGEIDLRVAYVAPQRDAVAAITEKIVAARTMVAQSQQRTLHVTLFAIVDAKSGPRLVELLDAPIAASVRWSKEAGFVVKKFEHKDGETNRDDASRTYTLLLANENGQQVLDRQIVLVSRGRILLQLVTENHRLPPEKFKRMVEELLQSGQRAVGER